MHDNIKKIIAIYLERKCLKNHTEMKHFGSREENATTINLFQNARDDESIRRVN